MSEKIVYYPGTSKVFMKVEVDDDLNINGGINVYDKDNSNLLIQRLVVKDDAVLFSEIKENNNVMRLVGDTKTQNFIVTNNGSGVIDLLGLSLSSGKLDFDGTTSVVRGSDFNISSTLIRNSETLKILNEMKFSTDTRLELSTSYREVGIGDYALSSHLINETGIEMVRKLYANGNYLKPVFMILKDIKEDEIHGVYNGNQVPIVGKVENLK